jgi:hypothetical protein
MPKTAEAFHLSAEAGRKTGVRLDALRAMPLQTIDSRLRLIQDGAA